MSTAESTTSSPLFRLTPELREKIFEYAVISQVTVPQNTTIMEPGLLMASKQVRAGTVVMARSPFSISARAQERCDRCGMVLRCRRDDGVAIPPSPPQFYKRSTFAVDISDWDDRTAYHVHGQIRKYSGSPFFNQRHYAPSRAPHWPNLVRSLKRHHVGSIGFEGSVSPKSDEASSATRVAVDVLFNMVALLDALPWSELIEILEQQRRNFVKINKRWADDRGEDAGAV
ncbi:uncharacterized protein LTR77_004249 [Saxophila tyrrhenica]|uniref:Uncharacterized protein n=1 Tax=Saxophila tyrrhenica TaxID=1690608 RepID=A0AAV9PCY2_9PEZI|nr:hypothetical protein LTR77_004249 [Saxophila tyrrhenica]